MTIEPMDPTRRNDEENDSSGGFGKSITPEMVVLARESRGMTQKELSEKLCISQGRLSKIETGYASPVPAALVAALAAQLDYPESFFYQEFRVFGPSTSEFYHRKRKAASAREIARIHALINIRMAHAFRFLKSAELERENFPKMDPEDFGGSAAEIARAVRSTWNLPKGPIKNVVDVIEESGGIVVRFPFGTTLVDAVSRWVPGLPPMFFVNAAIPQDRERLTLAHEIGHMVMHGAPSPSIEDEANAFAAEFLMPADEIKSQLHNLTIQKLASMKQFWKVSMQAILKRAQDLATITDGQARYLWIQIAKMGYRTREPAELEPAREHPRTLQELIDFHTETLGYTHDQLAKLISWNTPELLASYKMPTSATNPAGTIRLVK
jgi:Zn-dependent peptidase ImmA (M78 family)/transcriptional regulator with XRE-family HTH domain